ncbi:MAG: hypothetical protein QOD92_4396 [Acidimicrobiaceae bacterium]|jgi:hypothetical protein
MAKQREAVTEVERVRMAGHIGYELSAMADAFLMREDTACGVFTMEACWLHARNLIEFLVGRPSGRNPNDIWAIDYVADWDVSHTVRNAMHRHLEVLDQHLSHLARTRAAEHTSGSDELPEATARLVVDLVTLLRDFSSRVQSDAHSTPLRIAVQVAERRLGRG